ncbi:MAG TPA: acetolactate synthase [Phycisphaeraceae bacterium]|nr:acetolactate synthase [Phycisphaeraceae bacterium]
MSQFPSPETTEGYSPPTVQQFSVFLGNTVGKLLALVEQFDLEPNVQICALSVIEASDHAVIRLVPSNSDVARRLLRENGMPHTETNILVVELAQDHSLTSLCLHLLGAELNIRFIYPLLLEPSGMPTIAISIDDITLAGQILRRKGYRLLGEADLPPA